MPDYYCHNCKDIHLKTPTAIVDHAWTGHGVFIETVLLSVTKSEDAHLPPEKTGKQRIGFRCDDCKVLLENKFSLLRHLDKTHDIHIWYERGLTKKRVYLDGILSTETEQQGLLATSKKGAAPSKRPYEPRKTEENE